MSNPSVCFLSFAVINGMNFHIEDNLGEAIHIHIGKLRIALSFEDYFVFAESVMRAVRELFQIRHVELTTLDAESLKGEWLTYYDQIESARIRYVELESLYMKESYVRNRAIKRIIPLSESGYLKLLKGDNSDIEYYEELGKLQPSRKQKLDFIKQKIELEGYPWNCNLILVDQEGYIYDGIKRASYLYALYGGRKKIPVLCIHWNKEKSISEQIAEAEREVQNWNLRHTVDKNTQKRETGRERKIRLKQLIKELRKTDVPFFMLKKDKRNAKKELFAVATIIVEEGKLEIIKEKLKIAQQSISPYDEYEFLYTASKPLYYLTIDGPVLVFDRLCCKNKFEKCIIPVDRYVLEMSWKNTIWDEEWQCCCAAANIYALMILMDVLLECGYFEQTDIEFIESHKEILYQQDFKIMLAKEFYQYAPLLIGYLLSHQYDRAVSMYEIFSDY